jgi:hypothetical protein
MSVVGLVVLMWLCAGWHPVAIGDAIARGPSRLFSETLPLTGGRLTLSLLLVVTWVCGSVTAELLLRGRDAVSALALVPPIILYVIAYASTASAPGRDSVAAALFLVAVGAMALLRYQEMDSAAVVVGPPAIGETEGRPPPWRPAASGLIIASALALVLLATVPQLPSMSHRPAAPHAFPPTASTVVVDPLDAMAGLRDDAPRAKATTELTVAVSGASAGYLPVAILDDYDGALWQFDAVFRPTGGRIPALAGTATPAVANDVVTQAVRIDAPPILPLLPAIGRPVAVRGLAVLADDASGMIVTAGSARAGDTYTVTSRSPEITLADVPPADGFGETAPAVGSAVSATDYALPTGAGPDVATTLRFLSTIVDQRPEPTVGYLQAVLVALQSREKRIDPALVPAPRSAPASTASSGPKHTRPSIRSGGKARRTSTTTTTMPSPLQVVGGTSLSQVINAVTVDRSATPEQFATLFAMIARFEGIPSRVVTGYRIVRSSVGPPLDPGTYQVTNRQAWAWVEIPIAGIGWVVADPTPDATTGVSAPPPAQGQAPPTTLPASSADAVPRAGVVGHAVAGPTAVTSGLRHPAPAWLVVLLVMALVVAVLALVGPGAAGARRAWRRRSRRSADPTELAVGAWLELLDGLTVAGMRAAPGATSTEVAGDAAFYFGSDVAEPVAEVGRLADLALYSSNASPDHAAAESAWEAQGALRRSIFRTLDRRQKARALLSVGSSPRRPTVSSGRP